jgi:hypothetical protein
MAYASVRQCTGEHRELNQRRTAGATRIDVDVVARQDIQECKNVQCIGRNGGNAGLGPAPGTGGIGGTSGLLLGLNGINGLA